MTATIATSCPDCRNKLTVERYIPAAVIAEFAVDHRILSGNRFDAQTIVVTALGEPAWQEMARQARERVAARFAAGEVDADDLTATCTRRHVQAPERVMACTVCTHTHREDA